MEIIRIACLYSRAPAQNANKKTIQLTVPCCQETQKEYAVNSGAGSRVMDEDKPRTGMASFLKHGCQGG
jgi:hypothetical protein